jgi:Protein of unknown function (DUF2510)
VDTSSTTPGQSVVQQVRVREKPDVVLQRIQAAGMGARGYDVTAGAPGTVVFSRKFWPMWVIIVAVVGILVALLGLLALLYREVETLTVSVREDGDGSRVDISGKAKPELMSQITNALSALPGYEVVSGGVVTPGVVMPAVAPAAPAAPAAATAPPPPPPAPAGGVPAPPAPNDKKADWKPDPTSRHELRYWDGSAWTAHVSDQGKTATDAV